VKKILVMISFSALALIHCGPEKKTYLYEKFIIDERLPQNDTIKILSKHPEIKLFKDVKPTAFTDT